jgi:uncharacterized NAD(P)/FAD-binding protein YdhS
MTLTDQQAGRLPVIAVVGGGASGTLAVIHLLREAAAQHVPLRVALIDRHGRHGLGQAYSTRHPGHLLNSPADGMSAVTGDPRHLVRWARLAGITHDDFLTRQDYGRYLRELLADAQRRAAPTTRVSHLVSDVVAIRLISGAGALRLHLAADGRVDADVVVLATGNPPPAPPCPALPAARYVGDPWAPGALARATDGSRVIVAGTGLTMVDVAIAVTGADPRTTVLAVSRHGLLPREHAPGRPAPGRRAALGDFAEPVRLAGLIRQVRTAAEAGPAPWQHTVDALRPHLPSLWHRLPAADRRLFLRHVARYWEVHRHRLPPETASRIAGLRAEGRLSLLRGRVIAAADRPDGVRVTIDTGSIATEETGGWLVNGSGPATDITTAGDPLLRELIGSGLARPDPLRLGIEAAPDGAVLAAGGTPSDRIFTLGPPLRGVRYETTAIPEIRDQAASLARRLMARRPLRGPAQPPAPAPQPSGRFSG